MFEKQLNNTYGHKPEVWNAAKAQARSFLVQTAKTRGRTYYSELSLALFLCSDAASFITGVDYPLDGGFINLHR